MFPGTSAVDSTWCLPNLWAVLLQQPKPAWPLLYVVSSCWLMKQIFIFFLSLCLSLIKMLHIVWNVLQIFSDTPSVVWLFFISWMSYSTVAVCASDGTNGLAPAGWHCQSWHSLQPFYTLTHQFGAPFCEGPAFIQMQFQTIGYLLMDVMTTNHRQHIVFYVISGSFFEWAGI